MMTWLYLKQSFVQFLFYFNKTEKITKLIKELVLFLFNKYFKIFSSNENIFNCGIDEQRKQTIFKIYSKIFFSRIALFFLQKFYLCRKTDDYYLNARKSILKSVLSLLSFKLLEKYIILIVHYHFDQ
jgi:hypothetical protein